MGNSELSLKVVWGFVFPGLYKALAAPPERSGDLGIFRNLFIRSGLGPRNKPDFLNAQMNVNTVITKEYKNKSNWKLGENKPNTNPIRTQSNPISEKPK